MKNTDRIKSESDLNRIILHPNFSKSINDIQKANLNITKSGQFSGVEFPGNIFPNSGVLTAINEIGKVKLDAKNGYKNTQLNTITGYDESKLKYQTLEGVASFISHSQIITTQSEYIPVTYLSFYFYTRSKKLADEHESLIFAKDIETQSNYDYVEDRNTFLNDYSTKNSILLIDGPLIGGNISSYTVRLVEELHDKNILPVFIVKNSDSDLIVDNVDNLRGKFNSDLHWAYNYLKDGERTSYFSYTDPHNKKNAKVFYYLRFFDCSPQRIEFHRETFKKFQSQIDSIADIIYYLLILNGDRTNPQVRQVSLAEKYSRELLKFSNTYKLIKKSGLIPTMNQKRFG